MYFIITSLSLLKNLTIIIDRKNLVGLHPYLYYRNSCYLPQFSLVWFTSFFHHTVFRFLVLSSFPRDPVQRNRWVVAMRRKNFVPSPGTRICNKHFTADQYQIRPNCNYELLKPDAVPSVFDFSDHSSQSASKSRRPHHEAGVIITWL